MEIQTRILKFVTRSNWIVLGVATLAAFMVSSGDYARGILFGGLIVTVNFHLLSRTLQKALRPPHLASHNVVLAKYYARFIASGVIIFFLISKSYVHPIGLLIGLSVVVLSIVLATLRECKKLIFKEEF